MNEYLTREIWKMRKKITHKEMPPVVFLEEVTKKVYQLIFFPVDVIMLVPFVTMVLTII